MKTTPENPPAFPFVEPPTTCNVNTGMTLRDYFAAKAMHALVADSDGEFDRLDEVPQYAYQIADAMLKERSRCEDQSK